MASIGASAAVVFTLAACGSTPVPNGTDVEDPTRLGGTLNTEAVASATPGQVPQSCGYDNSYASMSACLNAQGACLRDSSYLYLMTVGCDYACQSCQVPASATGVLNGITPINLSAVAVDSMATTAGQALSSIQAGLGSLATNWYNCQTFQGGSFAGWGESCLMTLVTGVTVAVSIVYPPVGVAILTLTLSYQGSQCVASGFDPNGTNILTGQQLSDACAQMVATGATTLVLAGGVKVARGFGGGTTPTPPPPPPKMPAGVTLSNSAGETLMVWNGSQWIPVGAPPALPPAPVGLPTPPSTALVPVAGPGTVVTAPGLLPPVPGAVATIPPGLGTGTMPMLPPAPVPPVPPVSVGQPVVVAMAPSNPILVRTQTTVCQAILDQKCLLPPPSLQMVAVIADDGTLLILDGHHAWTTANQCGYPTINVVIYTQAQFLAKYGLDMSFAELLEFLDLAPLPGPCDVVTTFAP